MFTASERLRSHITHEMLGDPGPIKSGAGCHHHRKLPQAHSKFILKFILWLLFSDKGQISKIVK